MAESGVTFYRCNKCDEIFKSVYSEPLGWEWVKELCDCGEENLEEMNEEEEQADHDSQNLE